MTDDAKNNLLKYLTGNLETTTATDTLTVESEMYTKLGDFSTSDFTVSKICGVLPAKDVINDIDLLIYYGYGTKNGTACGCVIYCDNNNNFLQLVTTFASGSDLFYIYDMKIDEDGKMYAIGYNATESSGVIHTRLLLLSNIAQKNQLTDEYEVTLRISYRLQSNYYDDDSGTVQHPEYTKVIKDSTSASYLIYYSYLTFLYMIRFKIVYGESNEWEDYTTSLYYSTSAISVEWDDTNPLITILERDLTDVYNINKVYISSSSTSTTTAIDFSDALYDAMGTYSYRIITSKVSTINSSFCYINYVVYIYDSSTGYYDTYFVSFRLDYSSNDITQTFKASVGSTVTGGIENITSSVNNNTQVVNVLLLNFTGDYLIYTFITNYSTGYLVNYGGVGIGTTVFDIFPVIYNIYNVTYITDFYGPYNGDYYTNNFWFLYNEDIYSGQPYYNYNSLYADKMSLYNSDSSLIFNRDVSNIVINSNTVTTTMNVPNAYLNNESIETEKLLSVNNNIINLSNTTITKNIYEDLYINFINTVTMQDQNTSTYVTNTTGASRLVDSAFYTLDYSDTSMTKYRINYSDGTTYIGDIQSSQITAGTKEATYLFAIYLTDTADTLELISNDENTTYQTIDISSLSTGLYSISQHVYIE